MTGETDEEYRKRKDEEWDDEQDEIEEKRRRDRHNQVVYPKLDENEIARLKDRYRFRGKDSHYLKDNTPIEDKLPYNGNLTLIALKHLFG